MKKTESNNLAEKKTINVKLREKEDNSSKSKNLSQDQEKTQGYKSLEALLEDPEMIKQPFNTKMIEEAHIEDQKNISEQMDEIIKINDKFTLIESILYLLCKELEIPDRSQPGAIGAAIKTLYEAHYKSMENWKKITNLTKNNL